MVLRKQLVKQQQIVILKNKVDLRIDMRRPLVAGNWKMNKTCEQAHHLVEEMLPLMVLHHTVDVVLCPPFTSLMTISTLVASTPIGVGAQDLFWEISGAFTGEISPAMVKELCNYVIVGHSERRTHFGESDSYVNKKVKAALAVDLSPIVCIGETLVENEAGKTAEVVTRQICEGLKEIETSKLKELIIAYEPVWAIGTGKASSGEGANNVVKNYIRPTLKALFGDAVAETTRVLYGGSVTPSNASEFFIQPEIDGALVGGASIKLPDFPQIVGAAAKQVFE
jgi:triosephosphate isomerase